jgi:hypothetical protein
LLNKLWWVGVNRHTLVGLDWATLVDRLTDDVENTAKGCRADWHGDGESSVDDSGATDETLCSVHGDGADRVFTQVLGYFEDETSALEVLHLEGVENGRKRVRVEFDTVV